MKRSLVLVVALVLAACNQQPPSQPSPTPAATTQEPSPEETTDDVVDDTSYVVFPGDDAPEKLEVVLLCQAELEGEQILRGELENGGSIQIRKLPGGKLHASALPSPEADPVGTNVPSDSSFSEEGGFITGTSLMWLAGTENNISVDWHLRWDETVPPCDI